MRVKLIQVTQNPIDVMWTAARTCYSAKSPVEMWEDFIISYEKLDAEMDKRYKGGHQLDKEHILAEWYKLREENTSKHWNLVKKVLDSGHQSIAEHVYFTFAIEGISRACSHQLVRHRAGTVFSQQSQRYVEIKEDFEFVTSVVEDMGSDIVWEYEEYEEDFENRKQQLKAICEKYFVDVTEDNYYGYACCLQQYLLWIKNGMKPEDARAVLPNATKTNITMTLNYRELIHICNLRLCSRAQAEIRKLFTLVKDEVNKVQPELASYLIPSCGIHGLCPEEKCCGRRPSVNELKTVYKVASEDLDDVLSEADWDLLMSNIENPRVNENLKKLMEMESVIR